MLFIRYLKSVPREEIFLKDMAIGKMFITDLTI